ncbi:metal ABC transporter permease [Aquicoccus porphyridii]|uniref:metal ABC transporter permease n=1 Tax=Aquicoccus porphyridii TaxID=1852029 RepID=UPI00273D0D27|nr:metal ABC transporter permease [Aquicoccus porphyridii]
MLDDFLVRAALGAVGVAIAAALLGCFVVWRRMAYFGDATAHAALLGVALALGFEISVFAGVLVVALVMALSISALSGRGHAMDTSLGVMAHAALAFGLVAVELLPGAQVDIEAYLFGDILAVSRGDLLVIWAGSAVVAVGLLWRWQALLTATLNPELAIAGGLSPVREERLLILALAVVVAVAIKAVGALLITALLIIPAAAARPFARTPEGMALLAVALGVSSALGGLAAAWRLDTQAGPTIVCVAAILFAVSILLSRALAPRG